MKWSAALPEGHLPSSVGLVFRTDLYETRLGDSPVDDSIQSVAELVRGFSEGRAHIGHGRARLRDEEVYEEFEVSADVVARELMRPSQLQGARVGQTDGCRLKTD